MPDKPQVVDTVTVKLPSFWVSNAAAWFAQAEALFHLRGISQDDTKYYHVVATLDADTATRAACVLQNPPATDKYRAIKQLLLSTYELSEDERGWSLLQLTDLGDMRPSELMSRILHLNGNAHQHFLLRTIFLRALPSQVRQSVAVSQQQDLRQLASEADQLYVSCKESFVHEVQDTDVSYVRKKRRRSLCYFHWKFGVQARRCQKPCDWKDDLQPQGNASAGPR